MTFVQKYIYPYNKAWIAFLSAGLATTVVAVSQGEASEIVPLTEVIKGAVAGVLVYFWPNIQR